MLGFYTIPFLRKNYSVGVCFSTLLVCALFFCNAQIAHAQSNWTVVKDGSDINQIKFANSLYVAVGKKGLLKTSTDGINWTARSSGVSFDLQAVVYGNGKFLVAYVDETNYPKIVRTIESTDGSTWTSGAQVFTYTFQDLDQFNINGIEYINQEYVLFGSGTSFMIGFYEIGRIYKSSDGQSWSRITAPTYSAGQVYEVAFASVKSTSNNLITAVASTSNSAICYTTTDFINWTAAGTLTNNYATINGFAANNGNYIVVAGGGCYLPKYQ